MVERLPGLIQRRFVRRSFSGVAFRSIPAAHFGKSRKVAGLLRNRWPVYSEMGGRFGPKYAINYLPYIKLVRSY